MYKDKYHFIAILEYGDKGNVGVYFPDLPGCISGGDNTKEAVENAKEALSLHLYGMKEDKEEIPAPCGISEIKLEKNEISIMIEIYL